MLTKPVSPKTVYRINGTSCGPTQRKVTISMKTRTLLGLALFSLTTFAHAADSLCLQKEQGIQHEIELAKKHDNQRRVTGLERALTEAKAGCTDEKLKAQHQEKIAAHKQQVVERQKELEKEKADGDDSKKIAKREEKLAEAKHELKEVQAAPY
jgi:hypothetical protein